jgi:hypothetical protein
VITLRKVSGKSFPTASNALVVRHLVIYETASDVVLGFIRWAIGHPPKDDPDPIAGVTGWALSLHESKLLRVTDKSDDGVISLSPTSSAVTPTLVYL